MRARKNIIPLPLNFWNARLFIRFVGILKRLGCVDEYIVSLPDYAFAVHKTLALIIERNLTDLDEIELKAMESDLLSLRNIGLLINCEQMKNAKPFFTKQTESQLNNLIKAIQNQLYIYENFQMRGGILASANI